MEDASPITPGALNQIVPNRGGHFRQGFDARRGDAAIAGRAPKTNPYRRARAVLEKVAGEIADNGKLLARFREIAEADPAKFWRDYVLPLMPRDIAISADSESPFKVYLNVNVPDLVADQPAQDALEESIE